MMNSNDIRDVRFSKAMGGYKQEEVDNFLDSIELDYKQFESYVNSMNERVNALNAEIEGYKNSQTSVQNVLISAQQLADGIVGDAKAKAELIIEEAKAKAEAATSEAKAMLENFDEKLAAKRTAAENALKADIEKAKKEQQAIKAVTQECVERQQALFDKLRLEASAFKGELTEQYKKHIELIAKLPDCIAMDAVRAAKAIELQIEAEPTELPAAQPAEEEDNTAIPNGDSQQEDISSGFTVSEEPIEEDTDDTATDTDDGGFSGSFFSKSK